MTATPPPKPIQANVHQIIIKTDGAQLLSHESATNAAICSKWLLFVFGRALGIFIPA